MPAHESEATVEWYREFVKHCSLKGGYGPDREMNIYVGSYKDAEMPGSLRVRCIDGGLVFRLAQWALTYADDPEALAQLMLEAHQVGMKRGKQAAEGFIRGYIAEHPERFGSDDEEEKEE